MYRFQWEGGLLEVATNGLFGSSTKFDTVLYILDEFGNYITHGDDYNLEEEGIGSYIQENLPAGTYHIAITGFLNAALNSEGRGLFKEGTTGPLADWKHFTFGTGNYVIGFNATVTPPSPN